MVKIAALKRNANQSLSVTPMEPFIFLFPGTFTRRLFGGLTNIKRAKRRLDPYMTYTSVMITIWMVFEF